MKGLYDSHGLNHTAHLKHITERANISSYGCFESHTLNNYIGLGCQLVRTNPQGFLFPSPDSLAAPLHSFSFYMCSLPSSCATTGFRGELI